MDGIELLEKVSESNHYPELTQMVNTYRMLERLLLEAATVPVSQWHKLDDNGYQTRLPSGKSVTMLRKQDGGWDREPSFSLSVDGDSREYRFSIEEPRACTDLYGAVEGVYNSVNRFHEDCDDL